jgi:hypothetical protein
MYCYSDTSKIDLLEAPRRSGEFQDVVQGLFSIVRGCVSLSRSDEGSIRDDEMRLVCRVGCKESVSISQNLVVTFGLRYQTRGHDVRRAFKYLLVIYGVNEIGL